MGLTSSARLLHSSFVSLRRTENRQMYRRCAATVEASAHASARCVLIRSETTVSAFSKVLVLIVAVFLRCSTRLQMVLTAKSDVGACYVHVLKIRQLEDQACLMLGFSEKLFHWSHSQTLLFNQTRTCSILDTSIGDPTSILMRVGELSPGQSAGPLSQSVKTWDLPDTPLS